MQLLKNWLYNRFELNAFKLSDGQLKDYVAKINTEKPTWLEAYAQSLYELAVYINTNDIPVHNLNGVLASAETMYPKMKEEIESAFGTIIYNRYGSREVGDIACSCEEDNGLHLSLHNHYIEILDSDLNAVNPGEVGEVYVTTLNNYSMPLIRYKIEDLAVMLPEAECDCHRGWPRLERVEGKTINMFKTKDGRKLSGASFVVMMFFKPWIKKFQIVQKELEEIEIRVILNGDPNQDDINEVVRDIKIVMGESCQVNFVYLDELPSTKSGKYLYGISEI